MQNTLQVSSAGSFRVSLFSRTGLITVTAISTILLLLVTWTQPQGINSPVNALDLPGRLIMIHADFTPIEQLRSQQFTSSVLLRVHLLLPDNFETNGKGDVIRGSFRDAGRWTERSIADSNLILWTADLAPQPA